VRRGEEAGEEERGCNQEWGRGWALAFGLACNFTACSLAVLVELLRFLRDTIAGGGEREEYGEAEEKERWKGREEAGGVLSLSS
jgi:hypothetical protein